MVSFLPKKNSTVLVCDIGAGSVAVAVAEIRTGKASLVQSAKRSVLPQEERGESQRAQAIARLLKETAVSVQETHAKGGGKTPTNVIAVVHSPWARSRTVHADAELKSEMEVVADVFDKLREKALKDNPLKDDGTPFETEVVRTAVNGYSTRNPVGKKGRSVGITLLESVLDKSVEHVFSAVLHELIPGAPVTMHSATFTQTTLLREHAPQTLSYTIADVTSESVSLTVIAEQSVMQHVVVPVGWRSIVRALSTETGEEESSIQSSLRMLSDGTCETDACTALAGKIDVLTPGYTDTFGTAFAQSAKTHRFPNLLFLFAPPDGARWFEGFLARIDFAQFTSTARPFTVMPGGRGLLDARVVYTPQTTVDTGISMVVTFAAAQSVRG